MDRCKIVIFTPSLTVDLMKIEASRHQGQTTRNLIKDWLFTLNLFFIIYSLVMLATFLLGPQSGRLSTLVCKPDPWGKLVCTVKIYGVHKLFRLDFYANDYMETIRSSNFSGGHPRPYLRDLSLPWDNVPEQDSSDTYVCAVSIRIQSQLVDFVPPYQTGSVCSKAEAQLKAAFAGDRSAINLRFNGINPQVYWRIGLLVIASLLFFVQCAFRLRRSTREKNATMVAEDQKGDSQPGTNDSLSSPRLQLAEKEAQPVKLGRKKFILFWWIASVVVIVFLIFSSLINSLVRRGFWLGDCFLSIHDYQKLFLIHPITNLVVILPYIILITLGATLQWQVLRTVLPVSRWWIAAPVMAGIPLLIGLPPAQNCMDVGNLTFPAFLRTLNPQAAVVWSWVVYFLLFGIVQWLVLRKKLKYSIGWIVIPLLSIFLEVFLLIYLFLLGLSEIPYLVPNALILPALIVWAPIMLVLVTIINLVPGYYLYRLILVRRKKLLPDSNGGDEVVAG